MSGFSTPVDNSAWTTYTPTLSSFSGALTTASATGRYKKIGKTYFFQITATVTTKGTAAFLQASLPNSLVAADTFIVAAQEHSIGGMFVAIASSGASFIIFSKYDGTDGLFNGGVYVASGVIEAN